MQNRHNCFMCGKHFTRCKFIRADNSIEYFVNCVRCRSLVRRRDKLLENVHNLTIQLYNSNSEILKIDWEIYKINLGETT